MYQSCLLIDTGLNPDRPRPGRMWLGNLYRVHQRLCMGFPSPVRVAGDAHFLHPFAPEDFAQGHVQTQRDATSGFLFRVDALPGGRAVVLVQSAARPDWGYAFSNARHLLAAEPLVREYEHELGAGELRRFRLRANAVRRLPAGEPHTDGPRVPVPPERFVPWLEGRARGFELPERPTVTPGYVYVNKSGKRGEGRRYRSVVYEGVLRVTDPEALMCQITCGIGPAKAFGFGLLSVAPARD
ncbi:MAG: type I-E CRISPR-associated protein Cas6/Cse3/CasE [Phycisphaerales bacterium]|nr:type I-E CRISPR-associated protein Cas6/Cse3/CasE [Phycisphaerales bacterium]